MATLLDSLAREAGGLLGAGIFACCCAAGSLYLPVVKRSASLACGLASATGALSGAFVGRVFLPEDFDTLCAIMGIVCGAVVWLCGLPFLSRLRASGPANLIRIAVWLGVIGLAVFLLALENNIRVYRKFDAALARALYLSTPTIFFVIVHLLGALINFVKGRAASTMDSKG